MSKFGWFLLYDGAFSQDDIYFRVGSAQFLIEGWVVDAKLVDEVVEQFGGDRVGHVGAV